MKKFDFFEEGVRRVFENYELPVGENSWANFQASTASGVSSSSTFMRHFILPGIIAGGILLGMNMLSSDSHIAADSNHNETTEHAAHISNSGDQTNAMDHDSAGVEIDVNGENHSGDAVDANSNDTNGGNSDTHLAMEGSNSASGSSNNQTTSNATGSVAIIDKTERNNDADNVISEIDESISKMETIQYKGSRYKLGAPIKFTPNDDNKDDTFMPGELTKDTKFVLEISDRLGDIVFKSKSTENKWDGTILDTGKKAKQGEYRWRVLRISDEKHEIFQGKVKLVR